VITTNKEYYWYLYVTGNTQELSAKRGDIIHQMIEHIFVYVTFSNIMVSMLIIHRFLNFSQKRGEAKYSSLNFVCSTLMVILYKPELKNEWSKLSVRKMSINNWMLDILRWSINLWWLPQRKKYAIDDYWYQLCTSSDWLVHYSYDSHCPQWLLNKIGNKVTRSFTAL
jgi:hypothetical protein